MWTQTGGQSVSVAVANPPLLTPTVMTSLPVQRAAGSVVVVPVRARTRRLPPQQVQVWVPRPARDWLEDQSVDEGNRIISVFIC